MRRATVAQHEPIGGTVKWVAVVLNFFLPGLGYIIAVPEQRVAGVFWLLGAIGLTVVEQGMGLQQALPDAFKVMFVTVLVMNVGHVVNTLLWFKKKGA
jgi:hypothetical protein